MYNPYEEEPMRSWVIERRIKIAIVITWIVLIIASPIFWSFHGGMKPADPAWETRQ